MRRFPRRRLLFWMLWQAQVDDFMIRARIQDGIIAAHLAGAFLREAGEQG